MTCLYVVCLLGLKENLAIWLLVFHCPYFTDETEDQGGNVTLSPKSHRVTGRAGQEPKPLTEETRDFSVTLLGSRP